MFKKIIASLLCAALLAGCAPSPDSPPLAEPNAEASDAPVSVPPEADNGQLYGSYDDTLTLSMRSPKTLNPLLNTDITVDRVLRLIFEPLVVLDERLKPTPCLAKSFALADDALSAVVTLRDDLLWSDGHALSAGDVIFSLKTIENSDVLSIYKAMVENVASYKQLDGHTVQIDFINPDAHYAYRLCFPIIPEHYYRSETTADSPVNMSPIGNGPYRLDAYAPAKRLDLGANPYTIRAKPVIEQIDVLITPDMETDLYAFSGSVIDAVSTTIPEWGKHQGAQEANIAEYASDSFEFIGFNFNNPLLQDVRVRQAIACTVDMDDIMNSIFLDHAVKTTSPVNPDSWLYDPNTPASHFDLTQAAALMADAGVRLDIPLTILVNEENGNRVKIAEMMRENLAKVHIAAVVDVQPFESYMRMVYDQYYDLFVGGFTMGAVPDLTFAFHSACMPGQTMDVEDKIADEKRQNVFMYQNSTMDALLDKINANAFESDYLRDISELQKLFAEDLPCISLVYQKSALLTNKKVSGDVKPVLNNIFANINEWSMKTF